MRMQNTFCVRQTSWLSSLRASVLSRRQHFLSWSLPELKLIEKGIKPRSGETILITGAVGGVGRTAVHVARQHGAHVIAGVRSSQKKEAEALGADRILALDNQSEIASLKELDAVAIQLGTKSLFHSSHTSRRMESSQPF